MKKTLLFSLLSFFGLSLTYGQQLKPLYSKTDTLPRVVYKDLNERPLPKLEMQGKNYLGDGMLSLKSEGVKSVDINKEKGAVVIEFTPEYHPVLMSLSDIKKKYTNLKSERVIFRIEDNFVQNNPNEVLVDASNIMLISVSPVKFIGDLEDLYMVTLVPRTDKNVEKMNEIRIR
ncbi:MULTISPECIES: hypothetical protein [unclassified Sphingobacterium]|uniref:hypothetical protein n=1 Tax=unclassified Sphingobacterium TaxID=2609468 RepID=UPI0025D9486E|nr:MULTISPECIES: hypothetical protein [unclassified Sphingobacterium]